MFSNFKIAEYVRPVFAEYQDEILIEKELSNYSNVAWQFGKLTLAKVESLGTANTTSSPSKQSYHLLAPKL